MDLPVRPFINTLLWWAALQPSLRGIRALFRSRTLNPAQRFYILLFPVWLFLGIYMNLHNPSNDAYIAMFIFMALEGVFTLFGRRRHSGLEVRLRLCWIGFWTLTVKLIPAAMVIGLLALIFIPVLREAFRSKRLERAWVNLMLILLVSGCLYLYRGWIVSGIPGYPGLLPPESTWAPWAIRGTEVLHDGQKVMSRMQGDTPVVMEIANMWYRAAAGQPPAPPFDLHDPAQAWNQPRLWIPILAHTFWRYPDVQLFVPVLLFGALTVFLPFRKKGTPVWVGIALCMFQLAFLEHFKINYSHISDCLVDFSHGIYPFYRPS